MTNQNKKSFKQALTSEFKLILFLSVAILLVPIILELIQISQINAFSALTGKEKVFAILGVSDFKHLSAHAMLMLNGLAGLIMIPTLPLITARYLNGEKLSTAIGSGLSDYGKPRTWNYILKVFLPALIVGIVMYGLMLAIPDSMVQSYITNLFSSLSLRIVSLILFVIILTILSAISGILVITYVVYMRGSDRIKNTFKAISNREINKLLTFNFINISVVFAMIYIILKAVGKMKFEVALHNIFTIIIVYIVVMMISQIIFTYLRIGLYVNISSSIPFKESKDVPNLEANSQIEEMTSINNGNNELSIKPKRKTGLKSGENPFQAKR